MERRINRGNKNPKGRVGCDFAEEILRKKREREAKRKENENNINRNNSMGK
jgi:hypothetical protein